METQKTNKIVSFIGGKAGEYKINTISTISGSPIALCDFVSIKKETLSDSQRTNSTWVLQGFASNLRYTTRPEKNILDEKPSVLGISENKCLAMIPIKKNSAWWLLTQDERRQILEEDSKHIEIGFKYLATINRQLYHSRDLGEVFDFITWFEFSEENEAQFNELLSKLRSTKEWTFVEREVDIRMTRI